MSFRFFRRMKIAPGISLNLSRSGPSLSLGPRGAKLTALGYEDSGQKAKAAGNWRNSMPRPLTMRTWPRGWA